MPWFKREAQRRKNMKGDDTETQRLLAKTEAAVERLEATAERLDTLVENLGAYVEETDRA